MNNTETTFSLGEALREHNAAPQHVTNGKAFNIPVMEAFDFKKKIGMAKVFVEGGELKATIATHGSFPFPIPLTHLRVQGTPEKKGGQVVSLHIGAIGVYNRV